MNKLALIEGLFGNGLKLPKGKAVKSKAKILKVLSITAGGHHAWCEADCGIIRKPLGSIPDKLLKEANTLNYMEEK